MSSWVQRCWWPAQPPPGRLCLRSPPPPCLSWPLILSPITLRSFCSLQCQTMVWQLLMDTVLLVLGTDSLSWPGTEAGPQTKWKRLQPQTHPELWDWTGNSAPPQEDTGSSCTLTLLGCLKAVMEVNPLDVVSQGCVGQQGPVPVDDVGRKSKGMLFSIHDLGVGAICVLKDSSCGRWGRPL